MGKLWDRWLREPETVERLVSALPGGLFARLQEEYRQLLAAEQAADFERLMDDLIVMLEKDAAFRNAMQSRYRFIMVDEFQDTSHDNYRLLSLLAGERSALFLVGDDAQSIYRFRGADVGIMTGLHHSRQELVCHVLRRNYRSHSEIVQAANRLIACNKGQIRKKLLAAKGRGGFVRYRKTAGVHDEAAMISGIIRQAGDTQIAVLYRNNEYGALLRDLCNETGSGNVRWMTMLASKGLEFPGVIVAGVFEGMVPSPYNELEEERRLFYVAVTRAMCGLYVLYRTQGEEQAHPFVQEMRRGRLVKAESLLHLLQGGP